MMPERLFGLAQAFDHPVTIGIVAVIGTIFLLAPVVITVLTRTGRIQPALRRELWQRTLTWMALAPLMLGPIILGPVWTILAVATLGVVCHREYARATGLFREKLICLVVVLGIVLLACAALDHWYGLFTALFPLSVGAIAVAGILRDDPPGYIQRVALGVFSFVLFGGALGHLGYMANDRHYRPIVLTLLLCVALNDVFAFTVGKALGRHKLAPNTSPNKTVEGSCGALVLTTALAMTLGHWVFQGTALDRLPRLLLLGVIISVVGQLGDLMLSSIKRDLGIKDMAATLPGHGGWLDRFNSLLLTAPATFHYIHYHVGLGLDQPTRLLTGP